MGGSVFFSQFKALVWKNVLLKRRNKKQTFQELLMPIYFIAILAIIKHLVKPQTFPEIPYFKSYSLLGTNFSSVNGMLLVTPNSSYSHTVMQDVLKKVNSEYPQQKISIEYFTNAESLLEAYQTSTDKIFAGVILNYKSNNNLSYAIRFPFADIASSDSGDLYQDQGHCRNGDGLDSSNCDANSYLYTGFSMLQCAIDSALLKLALNRTTDRPLDDVNVQMMPKPGYIPDTSYIQIMSSIYFIIAYSPFINFLTVNLVAEKEKKIKESMKMMGLSDSAFWLSWGFVYTVIIVMVTAVVVVIAQVANFFAHSNMFLFFLMLVLYGITIIGAAFSITPFFKQAQVAGGVASLSSMLISLLYLVVSLTRTYTASGVEYTIPVWGRWILCLFSPVALALAIDQAIYLDIANPDGMTYSTIVHGDFTVIHCIIMLIVDAVLYFVLAVYLDNVIPSEYGPKQPPWYIFMPSYWCRKFTSLPRSNSFNNRGYDPFINRSTPADVDYVVEETLDDNVEKVSDDVRNKLAVRIKGLAKEFSSNDGKVTAVNGLSVDMYEDQITAILGHNGAGKTTTLNILTGLTGPTSGTAFVKDLDVSDPNDMTEIRSMTGVCPQHNILFEDLTCAEHLQLFSGIKGIDKHKIEKEIKEALQSVGLAEQRDVRSSALSGGQKRKLSVAIAILGDPKIIFLDEPTAGMDPYSRRHLWSVLKEKKKGRIILLTTHFMDEADILADRKAIINQGSLRCCGSSLFLKNKFGIGYHLNMVVENDCDPETVKQFVCGYITGADINRVHGQELDIMLPMSQVLNFAELFSALEDTIAVNNNNLGLSSYGISMTTLEEVFLALESETNPRDLEDLGRGKSRISAEPAPSTASGSNTSHIQIDGQNHQVLDEGSSLLGVIMSEDIQ